MLARSGFILMTLAAVCRAGPLVGADDQEDDYCQPLEDYGALVYKTETRRCCGERLRENCQWREDTQCMEVTDLECEVRVEAVAQYL